MEALIIQYVASHPNCRARNVASYLNHWVCEVSLVMRDMTNRGLLVSKEHHDPAQMEWYHTYTIPEP